LSGWMSQALAAGSVDGVQGVARIEGTVTVNGKLAKVGTPVQAGDKVVTSRGAQVVIVVGKDAMLLRDQTAVELKGAGEVLSDITVVSGKVLAVFGKKELVVK